MGRNTLLATALTAIALAGVPLAPADAARRDPLRAAQWALDAIHLDGLARGSSRAAPAGAGALVAIIDSGVEATHPDLAGRVVRGPDLVDGPGGPDDPHGHGTHMAGIVAATAGNGRGGAGIAPASRILAIRVLDEHNVGSAAHVAAGIDAARAAGADVINLSLNWTSPSEALAPVTAAMQRAADAGIAVVVAAGNDAQARCEEPILPRRALCVGAVSSNLRLAPFSSHGTGLGIVAPGSNLLSTWRDGEYARASGTSQAAAVASGVAALLVGLGLRGQDVVDRLVRTARDIGPRGRDGTSGYGLLDATRAVTGAARGKLPPVLRVSAPRRARSGTVRRRGLRVRCDAARAGTCRARVRIGRTTVARGSRRTDGTAAVTIRLRATAAGRRLLRRPRTRKATVVAAFRGAPGARRRVTLVAG